MSVLPMDAPLKVKSNPLQGEPKDKPLPRKIIRPDNGGRDSTRAERRKGRSSKTGLPKISSRYNQNKYRIVLKRRKKKGYK